MCFYLSMCVCVCSPGLAMGMFDNNILVETKTQSGKHKKFLKKYEKYNANDKGL